MMTTMTMPMLKLLVLASVMISSTTTAFMAPLHPACRRGTVGAWGASGASVGIVVVGIDSDFY
jgi:hypothetical protein